VRLNPEHLALGVLLIIVTSSMYFASAPQAVIEDDNRVETTNALAAVAKKNGAAGTIHVKTTNTVAAGTEFDLNVYGNIVSEPREQTDPRTKAGIEITYTRNRSLIEPSYNFPFDDLGTFATVIPSEQVDDLVVGLRISPARLVYGSIAPDILLAQHYMGLGISCYAPPDIMGRSFSHWGLGLGRFWGVGDTAGNADAWAVYLSFSTKIP
jgi:hypothetical protein